MNPVSGSSFQVADEFWDICVCAAPACPWPRLTPPVPLGHCPTSLAEYLNREYQQSGVSPALIWNVIDDNSIHRGPHTYQCLCFCMCVDSRYPH